MTNEGVYFLGPLDIREADAKWRKSGAPANLEAAMLQDFCEYELRDEALS